MYFKNSIHLELLLLGKSKPRGEVHGSSDDVIGITTPECCHKASVTFKKSLCVEPGRFPHSSQHLFC